MLLGLMPTFAASILLGEAMRGLGSVVIDGELQKLGLLMKPYNSDFVTKHFVAPDTLKDQHFKEYRERFDSDPSTIFGQLEDSHLMGLPSAENLFGFKKLGGERRRRTSSCLMLRFQTS